MMLVPSSRLADAQDNATLIAIPSTLHLVCAQAGECVASFGAEDGGHLRAMAINTIVSLDNRTLASGGSDAYIKVGQGSRNRALASTSVSFSGLVPRSLLPAVVMAVDDRTYGTNGDCCR
jgi:hypothetical protein